MIKITSYVVAVFIGFLVGCMSTDSYTLWSRQLETHLKHEFKNKKNVIFTIPETGIEITKLADGSGIVRIK